MPRAVLVETVPEEAHRHHGAEVFPFVLGWLRGAGWTSAWWTFEVPADRLRRGARYVVDLSDRGRTLLAKELARFRPDAVVFHNRPAPALARLVEASTPGARIVDLTEGALHPHLTVAELSGLLLGDGPAAGDLARGSELLLDAVEPRFERTIVEAGEAARGQAARLAGEEICLHRTPVREAGPFRDLATPSARQHRGCSFCTRGAPAPPGARRLRTGARELALRQVEAHQRDRALEGPAVYLVEHGGLSADPAGFLEAVLRRGIAPATFYLMPRVDELLAQREPLLAVLPRVRAAGHRFGLLSQGIENFSAAENERFNKGITADQVWACLALMEELLARFPGTVLVEAGRLAGILFTPWTRLEDLRANVEAARRLGAGWLQRVVGVRLQILPGTPIADLAARDGLLAASGAGSVSEVDAVCLNHPDGADVPWRFADRRTEIVHRILIRLDPHPPTVRLPPDDPLLSEVRALRARLPPAVGGDHLALAAAVLDAAEALGPGASPSGLLEAIATAHAVSEAESAPAGAVPGPSAGEPAPEELWIVFTDRLTGSPRCTFRVDPARPGEPAFRVVGPTRIVHDRCARDATFWACAAIATEAARRVGGIPSRAEGPRWASEVASLLAEAGVSRAVRAEVRTTHPAPPPPPGPPAPGAGGGVP